MEKVLKVEIIEKILMNMEENIVNLRDINFSTVPTNFSTFRNVRV